MHDAGPDPRKEVSGASSAQGKAAAPAFPDLESMGLALQAGGVGLWSWDIKTDAVTWMGNLAEIHGIRTEDWSGSFASFQRVIHSEDQPDVIAAIQESLRSRKPYHMLYRLAPRDEKEERWIEAMASVIEQNGEAVRLVGICRDVTDRQKLLRELRARAKQQEIVAKLGERALTESDLQALFEEIVTTIADILGVEFVKILELEPGDAELLLRAGHGWQPGAVGTAHESSGRHSQAGYALASGAPVIVTDLKSETRFEGPALLRDHGVNCGVSAPIAGRDGRAYGVLGAHTARRRRFGEHEVSFVVAIANLIAGAIQRRQADQRHELMIRELRHRSGNLFAQLLALFSQTSRTSRSVADLTAKYEARVLALANAHRLITEGGWQSTSLRDLLRVLLAPYIDRVTLGGPDVFLDPDPSFALSSALHELATNASKYGSLSNAAGKLELSWNVERADRGVQLVFEWKERGGPAARRARRVGFGSRLIGMGIERQLNGQVTRTFGPNGMEAKLVMPVSHDPWPEPADQSPIDGETMDPSEMKPSFG